MKFEGRESGKRKSVKNWIEKVEWESGAGK